MPIRSPPVRKVGGFSLGVLARKTGRCGESGGLVAVVALGGGAGGGFVTEKDRVGFVAAPWGEGV